MKPRMRHSTGWWITALACLLFGFVPLVVVGVTAGMEFLWLFATDAPSLGWPAIGSATLAGNAFDQVVHDWASLYTIDGQYDARFFVAQVLCAIFWCVYMGRMRWRLGRR